MTGVPALWFPLLTIHSLVQIIADGLRSGSSRRADEPPEAVRVSS